MRECTELFILVLMAIERLVRIVKLLKAGGK